MKVLVIDEWLPWPLDSGKKIRTFNLIAGLASKHEIVYMAFSKLDEDYEKISIMESKGIRVIGIPDVRTPKWTFLFYAKVIKNIFSKKPFSTIYHIKKPFWEKLHRVLIEESPALIHCEWTNLAPFLENIDYVPRVITAHNVESDIWKRLAENSMNPLKRLIGKQQARRIEKLEKKWYPRADHCIAVSEEDGSVLSSYGARVTVIENGVDVRYYDADSIEVESKRLAFVASFDIFTNQDAVHFFVRKIFPLVKIREPRASFWIIGKEPPKSIKRYSKIDKNIYVTGTVPDVRRYLSPSTICVVPLRIGGGSRLKILEAMAMRKPVISTSIGAEGLRVTDGRNIIIADSANDFAKRICELLADQKRRHLLGEAGWELVRSRYDWEYLVEKQDRVWHSITAQ